MRLIKMIGGLGNQMFIYALYLRMRRDFPHTRIDLSDMQHYHAHHGYEMQRVFALPPVEHCKPRWVMKILIFLFFRVVLERRQKGSLRPYRTHIAYPLVYFKGFYQNERYFADIAQDVRKAFTFDLRQANARSLHLRQALLQDTHSVAIHVRRGDYLQPPFVAACGNVCTLAYYQNAIRAALEADSEAHFYLFSDDLAWVVENLALPAQRFVAVDWNTGADSWQDMMLMSLCRQQVIANSTFSWWAAWLNPHTDKRIYCPTQWTHGNDSSVICLPEWIRISSH